MNNSKLNVVLHREGNLLPVTLDQDKCLIRTVRDSKKVDCCAIFNGPYGTALRSYTDNVLVNGEPAAARWLNAGDQIQLPCSTRIEVKAATNLRPAMPHPLSSASNQASALESALSGLQTVESIPASELQAPSVEIPASPVAAAVEAPIALEQEETFHSPFSQDAADHVTAEPLASMSQPVAEVQQVAPVEVVTPQVAATEDASPEVTEADPVAGELESIFARLGVTNVGSIANPGAISKPTVQDIPDAPTQEPQSDAALSIRRELESIFADVPAAPQPTIAPSVEPVSKVEASTESPVSSVLSEIVDQPVSDPLAELPDDLRNQLNSLVSSLESDRPAETGNESAVEALAPFAAATATAAAVAASIPAIPTQVHPELPTQTTVQQETEAVPASMPQVETMIPETQSVASEGVAEEAKPVRDEEISSMFDEVMRAIQKESKTAESTAVEKPESVSSVEALTAVEPAPAVLEAPVVAEPKAQSVADILGAMGMEVPGDDEVAVAQTETPTPTPAPITPAPITPAPAQTQSVPSVQVFANMQTASESTDNAAPASGEAEDDIQAYMNKLLNRAAPKAGVVAATQETDAAAPVAAAVAAPAEAPAVLSKEEFVPSHKPSRPQNYDTLREIANSSSRSAINQCQKKALKESATMKLAIGLIALLLAGAAFWFGQPVAAAVLTAVTAMCVVACFLKKDPAKRRKAVVKMTKNSQA